MSCPHKDYCPAYTGWCDSENRNLEQCISFLLYKCQDRDDIIDGHKRYIEELKAEVEKITKEKNEILVCYRERLLHDMMNMQLYRPSPIDISYPSHLRSCYMG